MLGKKMRESPDGVRSALRVLQRVADESNFDASSDDESQASSSSASSSSVESSSQEEDLFDDENDDEVALPGGAFMYTRRPKLMPAKDDSDDDSLVNNDDDEDRRQRMSHPPQKRRRKRPAVKKKTKKRREEHPTESSFVGIEGHQLATLGRGRPLCRVYAPLDTSAKAQAQIIAHRIFLCKAYEYLLTHLAPNCVLVDGGANLGLFLVHAMLWIEENEASLLAADLSFVAVEPNPLTTRSLIANAERYCRSERWTTQVVTAALGASKTSADLVWKEDAPSAARIVPHGELDDVQRHRVNVRSLGEIIDGSGLARRKVLLKLSIEGAEVDALKGDLTNVAAAVVETRFQDDVVRLLRDAGFLVDVQPAFCRPPEYVLVFAHRDLEQHSRKRPRPLLIADDDIPNHSDDDDDDDDDDLDLLYS